MGITSPLHKRINHFNGVFNNVNDSRLDPNENKHKLNKAQINAIYFDRSHATACYNKLIDNGNPNKEILDKCTECKDLRMAINEKYDYNWNCKFDDRSKKEVLTKITSDQPSEDTDACEVVTDDIPDLSPTTSPIDPVAEGSVEIPVPTTDEERDAVRRSMATWAEAQSLN